MQFSGATGIEPTYSTKKDILNKKVAVDLGYL